MDFGGPELFKQKTGPDTIYIGYNPKTGEYPEGQMRTVEVDPGCKGP